MGSSFCNHVKVESIPQSNGSSCILTKLLCLQRTMREDNTIDDYINIKPLLEIIALNPNRKVATSYIRWGSSLVLTFQGSQCDNLHHVSPSTFHNQITFLELVYENYSPWLQEISLYSFFFWVHQSSCFFQSLLLNRFSFSSMWSPKVVPFTCNNFKTFLVLTLVDEGNKYD